MNQPNHPRLTDTCAVCNGPIEYVDVKDPYWRHTDMRNLAKPHGARPRR